MNLFALAGTIIEKPEKLKTENGTKLCRLKIAVNKNGKDTEDEKEIFEVTVFRNLAEEEYEEGQFVCVSGRMSANNYKGENKEYYNANLIGNSLTLQD